MRLGIIKQGLATRYLTALHQRRQGLPNIHACSAARRSLWSSSVDGSWHKYKIGGQKPELPSRDGAQHNSNLQLEGILTCCKPIQPPEYFEKPLTLESLPPASGALTTLAKLFLRELKGLGPESIHREIQIRNDGRWVLSIETGDRPFGSQQYSFRLQFSPPSNVDWRETKTPKLSTCGQGWLTTMEIRGAVNLQQVPKLTTEALDSLADTIIQNTSNCFSGPVRNLKNDALASELANVMASDFVKNQQDLVLQECRIGFHRDQSSSAFSSGIVFGGGEMDFETLKSLKAKGKSRFFVALGSNVGDRLKMIEQACLEMEKEGIEILRTSGLWETKAMYVEDQANFLNGVCEVISADENPKALLLKLKSIEERLGRVKLIEKGPRSIDLDVLLWNYEPFENDSLEMPISVPHKLMLEREFVLRPLCELVPNETLPSPFPPFTFATHLQRLQQMSTVTTLSMSTQVELSASLPPLSPLFPSRRTQVMSILNLTPDSFSDGGIHNLTESEKLKSTITTHLASGATIIDIGGQTSRPGAVSITAEEEINRIEPAIRFLKEYEASHPDHGLAISIDTYRASVAEKAVAAGAHIINDISAGLLDAEMLPTVAKLGCTYILMHMRGTPETMTSKEHTTYNGDLVQIVGAELLARVQAAEAAGIRRWRMILDPGIGFAKNLQQNLELLRRLEELRTFPGLQGIPWLVGTSRKGFIGKITGVSEAGKRVLGTAATVTAAVQGGADIVRVHDVKEMGEVVKMSDALYRGWIEDK